LPRQVVDIITVAWRHALPWQGSARERNAVVELGPGRRVPLSSSSADFRRRIVRRTLALDEVLPLLRSRWQAFLRPANWFNAGGACPAGVWAYLSSSPRFPLDAADYCEKLQQLARRAQWSGGAAVRPVASATGTSPGWQGDELTLATRRRRSQREFPACELASSDWPIRKVPAARSAMGHTATTVKKTSAVSRPRSSSIVTGSVGGGQHRQVAHEHNRERAGASIVREIRPNARATLQHGN